MKVEVLHRSGQWCGGRQVGDVVGYDVRILPEYQVPGRPTVGRSYLLGEGVQLTKPAVFEGPVEGWWYVDLVEIERTDRGLVVHTAGRLAPAQCSGALTTTPPRPATPLLPGPPGKCGVVHP